MFDAADFTIPWPNLPDFPLETTIERVDEVFAGFPGVQEQDLCCNAADQPVAKRRKPKAPTLRNSDWEPHKSRILELYIEQNLDLQSVQKILKEEKGFYAE